MSNDDIWTVAFILFASIAVVLIGMTLFKGAHFSPHTWTKIGGAIFLCSTGGYWFLKHG